MPECNLTLNDLFELWRKNKVGLKEHTFANYVYMYNRFVRDEIGMMKLKDIRSRISAAIITASSATAKWH